MTKENFTSFFIFLSSFFFFVVFVNFVFQIKMTRNKNNKLIRVLRG